MEINIILWLFILGISFTLIIAGILKQYMLGFIGGVVAFSVVAVFDTLIMFDGSAMILDWYSRLILGTLCVALLMVTVIYPSRD